jgi:two-component system nitrogen regulation sensor histidine kinase NtrY
MPSRTDVADPPQTGSTEPFAAKVSITPMTPKTRKIWMLSGITLLILVLMTIVFVEQAININKFIFPTEPSQAVVLFALTTLIVVALIVFSLILTRFLVKIIVERRSVKVGSKFKTKLLAAFLGLAFIPAIFLFIFAYGLINRSLDKWFSFPVDSVLDNARGIVTQYEADFAGQTYFYAKELATSPVVLAALRSGDLSKLHAHVARTAQMFQIEAVTFYDLQGKLILRYASPTFSPLQPVEEQLRAAGTALRDTADISRYGEISGQPYSLAGTGVFDERLHLVARIAVLNFYPVNLQSNIQQITVERSNYTALARDIKTFKKVKVMTLLLITIAIVFSASWIAVYLSKRITIPIQALAEATQEVAAGHLDYRVSTNAQDELKLLVDSFNAMTQQLDDKNEVIQRSTEELERANREMEARRHYIETIVESVPSGVVSLTNDFQVTQWNSAVRRMLNPTVEPICSINDLFDPTVTPVLEQILARARVLSIASREIRLPIGEGRNLYCAITACALREPNNENLGYILVIEDLTEVLKAQKSAAWREVARRMAHEIKNPLTPIRLSAERLLKQLERVREAPASSPSANLNADSLHQLVTECATTITQEVSALKNMVDEFSRFARLPSAKPVASDLNRIIEQTLSTYDGRLKDIAIETQFRPGLPDVNVDPEQFKRVLVNLIDNALEAMADLPNKRLVFKTRFDEQRETVEVAVEDSGHGVRPQDKDKLFLPYFSTRKQGTGLGLAIVDRIVADHNGLIRVENNSPCGSRFIIELPATNA